MRICDFRANRGAELNKTGQTPDEAVARLWLALVVLGRNNCDELRKAALVDR